MNGLHYLLPLRHPRRFGCSAIVIAVASAFVLGPPLDSTPWLMAIPFVGGGLLVALGELWDDMHAKRPQNGDDTQSPCRQP